MVWYQLPKQDTTLKGYNVSTRHLLQPLASCKCWVHRATFIILCYQGEMSAIHHWRQAVHCVH